MSPILERLYELIRKRGTNAKRVCEELKLSNSAFTDWKKGKAKPGVEALTKLALYFGVSLDYLILGKEDAPPVTPESVVRPAPDTLNLVNNELCGKFHRLSPENQGKLMAYLDGMLAASSSAIRHDAPPVVTPPVVTSPVVAQSVAPSVLTPPVAPPCQSGNVEEVEETESK